MISQETIICGIVDVGAPPSFTSARIAGLWWWRWGLISCCIRAKSVLERLEAAIAESVTRFDGKVLLKYM